MIFKGIRGIALISTSQKWKKELDNLRSQIIRYNTSENIDKNFEATFFKIERALLYSATNIRVLIESHRLSDEAEAYSIYVTKNRPIKEINGLNKLFDKNAYDLEDTCFESVLGKNVCNWILHSYIFHLAFEEKGHIVGFSVSSDFDKNKGLYTLKLDDWLDYMNFLILDNIIVSSVEYSKKKNEYMYTKKKRGDLLK